MSGFARMKLGVGLQRRCWREDLLNHTESSGARVRRPVCMARDGFRFAAGKPDGRRRAPTLIQEVQDLAPHGEVDRSIFCYYRRFACAMGSAFPKVREDLAGRKKPPT